MVRHALSSGKKIRLQNTFEHLHVLKRVFRYFSRYLLIISIKKPVGQVDVLSYWTLLVARFSYSTEVTLLFMSVLFLKLVDVPLNTLWTHPRQDLQVSIQCTHACETLVISSISFLLLHSDKQFSQIDIPTSHTLLENIDSRSKKSAISVV